MKTDGSRSTHRRVRAGVAGVRISGLILGLFILLGIL
jgi:hypothetical protein